MLVISMSDFLGNPSQYMERAQHTEILVENAGKSRYMKEISIMIKRVVPRIFASLNYNCFFI